VELLFFVITFKIALANQEKHMLYLIPTSNWCQLYLLFYRIPLKVCLFFGSCRVESLKIKVRVSLRNLVLLKLTPFSVNMKAKEESLINIRYLGSSVQVMVQVMDLLHPLEDYLVLRVARQRNLCSIL